MADTFELVTIGAGPAALSAARGYREAGGQGPVAIVADEGRMPYARPPLTKEVLRGDADEASLPLEDPVWLQELGVSLVSGRAVALDGDRRRVTLSGGRILGYRACVLATGAEPRRLPVPGADDPGVRVLRTLDHLRELLAHLQRGDPVVVVGSGFIGCEIAVSLTRRGHAVSLVSDEPLPNARRLGEDAGRAISTWLRDDGVDLVLGTEVESIDRRDGKLRVTAGPRRLMAPTVVMAVGVAPRSELVASAGLSLHEGAVPVDSAMRSGLVGVLAAGDVAFAENVSAGRPLRVEHWGDALGQGTIAGRTAAGVQDMWRDVPGFWSTIGSRVLKYAAWGDGYDVSSWEPHEDGGFVARYGREGRLVGVLAHRDDDAYEHGRREIRAGAPWR